MEDLVTECATVPGWKEGVSFLLLKGAFLNRFVSHFSTAINATLKIKIPPFIVNYVPVGHNCDLGCLLDHLRKLRLLHSFLGLFKFLPKKTNYFTACL